MPIVCCLVCFFVRVSDKIIYRVRLSDHHVDKATNPKGGVAPPSKQQSSTPNPSPGGSDRSIVRTLRVLQF